MTRVFCSQKNGEELGTNQGLVNSNLELVDNTSPFLWEEKSAPTALELHSFWRTAALDVRELLGFLDGREARTRKRMQHHPKTWRSRRTAMSDWTAANLTLSRLEYLAERMQWLRDQADAALAPSRRRVP